MAPVVIASVVEGEGEVRALPNLLHRIARTLGVYDLQTPKPMRVPRSRLVGVGGIELAVEQQAHRVHGHRGGVLVVLDADDDCPASLAPSLLARARQTRPDIPISVVLACREYESWFLAAAASLAGQHGFPETMTPPPDPDNSPRDAKGWLTHQRGKRHPYKETVDQLDLTRCFDLALARANSPSFDKLYRDIARLLGVEAKEG